MPIAIRVDRARRLRYVEASGVVTDADVIEGYGGSFDDPSYEPALDVLFDGRRVERLDVTTAAVRRLAELVQRVDRAALAAGATPRVAIVVPSPVAFGLARMYQAYREAQQSRRVYFVCRTIDEANRWLGMTDEGSEAPEGVLRGASPDAPRPVAVAFSDPVGVRWYVAPRLVGRGPDALPAGFEFTSEHGERRFLRWDPREFFSPREVDEDRWRSMLQTASVET